MHLLWKKFKKFNYEAQVDECGIEIGTSIIGYDYIVTRPIVIHIVSEGEGDFIYDGVTHHLCAGDVFVLKKGMKVQYNPSINKPWRYYWVGISGKQAHTYFSRSALAEHIVMKNYDTTLLFSIISKICDLSANMDIKKSQDILLNQYLFELLHCLQETFPTNQDILDNQQLHTNIQVALDFINQNFTSNITIDDVAKKANLSRSYLYKMFIKHFNVSPKTYLIHLRMYQAAQLLIQTSHPISYIAYSVGYKDPLVFSKSFKHYFKISATAYRARYGV
ncbi:AraC family transcriptional regulator [Staphylococcus succinus]|uniref:helix-turn-helix transcriptional regulator n=1 Tax=Staphylococcus succinus TaxID=61015 RepID=UPI003F5B3D02